MVPRQLFLVLLLLGFSFAAAPGAAAKDKAKPPPAKTGTYSLDFPPTYIYLSVPADYDASKAYPLLFVLHPSEPAKPDDFVAAWAETPLAKTWIIASRYCPVYDNEETLAPLKDALAKVKSIYKVDDRRVVLAGHNAGALMAWRLWTREPALFGAIVALDGEVPDADRNTTILKPLMGKSAYIFRGAKDSSYTTPMLERDRKLLEAMKISLTVEVKAEWGTDFPRGSTDGLVKWVDGYWPAGTYREKADAVEKALAAKDLSATFSSLAVLQADLKKNPYPAFESRLAAYQKAFLEAGRGKIDEAKRMLDGGQPLMALDAMEGVVKDLRGLHPLDTEASAALAALKKQPAVQEALRKKEAEASASSYMERAAAAEAKGDLAKALDWYRKVVSLGDTSKKADADAKIKDLEPKVAGK